MTSMMRSVIVYFDEFRSRPLLVACADIGRAADNALEAHAARVVVEIART